MFNQPGLDEFWSQGLKNYGEEHLFYQLLTELNWEGPSEQSWCHLAAENSQRILLLYQMTVNSYYSVISTNLQFIFLVLTPPTQGKKESDEIYNTVD